MRYNLIVGITLCICLWVSSIHRFYLKMTPVAEPGECISVLINEEGDRVKLMILENNSKERMSLVSVEDKVVMEFSYDNLWELDPEKVDC